MGDKLEVDYDHLAGIGQKLMSESESIQQLHQQTSAMLDRLRGSGWIGRGADAFFLEMNTRVLPATRRLANALQEARVALVKICDTFRQAEMESSNLFTGQGDAAVANAGAAVPMMGQIGQPRRPGHGEAAVTLGVGSPVQAGEGTASIANGNIRGLPGEGTASISGQGIPVPVGNPGISPSAIDDDVTWVRLGVPVPGVEGAGGIGTPGQGLSSVTTDQLPGMPGSPGQGPVAIQADQTPDG